MSNKYRWTIYKSGYVSESGEVTDDYVLLHVDEKPQHVSDDYFAVKQEYEGVFWNDVEDSKIIGEYFANEDRTVKCTLNFLQDHTDHRDLDADVHKGFTIGNGKILYFMYIWHRSGNATVYPINGKGGRYVKGDCEITIHFK